MMRSLLLATLALAASAWSAEPVRQKINVLDLMKAGRVALPLKMLIGKGFTP